MKIEGSHALAGRKRNKRKNRSRRLLRDPLNPEVATRKGRERERERRARFERVSRPRFISVGSVSEARLRCQVVASGLKWCS